MHKHNHANGKMNIEEIIFLARDKLVDSGLMLEKKQAMAIVALLVITIVGILILHKASQPKPVIVTKSAGDTERGPTKENRSRPKAQERLLMVHVAGAVVNPGVHKLKEGSRVIDAVNAAGGGLESSDLDALNLAAKVFDGQKVYVVEKGKALPPGEGSSDTGQVSGSDSKINMNTATLEQLDSLPGVGQVTAKKIIEYRDKRGSFKRVNELMDIDGIGNKKYDQLKDKLYVD